MTIAVTTPTGNVGVHVVKKLINAGVDFIVLARDTSRFLHLTDYCEVREVDQRNSMSVIDATRDVTDLFWVTPPGMFEDPIAEYARLGEILRIAIIANNIRRVVFQSSVGAEKNAGAGEIDGLSITEKTLKLTDADVMTLRCGYFFTNLLLFADQINAGYLPTVTPLDLPMPWVAPSDIAEVAVSHLLSNNWSGKQVKAVHGPRDLTWNEVAEIVSQATGHRFDPILISDSDMFDALVNQGMPRGMADSVVKMSSGLRDNFVPEQIRTLETTTGTTLEAWSYDTLRHKL